MLEILLTPTMIVFKNLDDNEIFADIKNNLNLEVNAKNGYYIKGSEKELFKILLKLSYDYDIEIT